MDKEIKVSIIIPVYNVEKYLRQCLDSVCNQTFKDIEIIVVNDCSPDNSLQIIKEYQQKDDRIVLIDLKQNVGLGFARNEGIKHAKGKYITFVDSDDWVTKDYIEVLYNAIEQYKCDVVVPCFYIFDNVTKKQTVNKFNNLCYEISFDNIEQRKKLLSLSNIYYAISKIYNKNFIENNNICFRMNKMEDGLFIYENILACNNIKFIKQNIYFYRANRSGSIMSNKTTRIYQCIELLKNIRDLLVRKNLYSEYEQVFYTNLYNLLASEIEVSTLSNKKIKEILCDIKRDFNIDFSKSVYIFESFHRKIKVYIFKYCLKYNINYRYIGKILKKVYAVICKLFDL